MPPGEIRPNIRPWGIPTNDPSQRGCFFFSVNQIAAFIKAQGFSPRENLEGIFPSKIGRPLFWVFPNCISSLTARFHMCFFKQSSNKTPSSFYSLISICQIQVQGIRILRYENDLYVNYIWWPRYLGYESRRVLRQSERNTWQFYNLPRKNMWMHTMLDQSLIIHEIKRHLYMNHLFVIIKA